MKRQKLSVEKLQKEIDQLEKEIETLQSQIGDLQDKILKAEASVNKPSSGPTARAASGGNIGPRGGCYTITKSGKKNYGGC